jgi:hypothetical protein
MLRQEEGILLAPDMHLAAVPARPTGVVLQNDAAICESILRKVETGWNWLARGWAPDEQHWHEIRPRAAGSAERTLMRPSVLTGKSPQSIKRAEFPDPRALGYECGSDAGPGSAAPAFLRLARVQYPALSAPCQPRSTSRLPR